MKTLHTVAELREQVEAPRARMEHLKAETGTARPGWDGWSDREEREDDRPAAEQRRRAIEFFQERDVLMVWDNYESALPQFSTEAPPNEISRRALAPGSGETEPPGSGETDSNVSSARGLDEASPAPKPDASACRLMSTAAVSPYTDEERRRLADLFRKTAFIYEKKSDYRTAFEAGFREQK